MNDSQALPASRDALFDQVYDQLKRLAHRQRANSVAATLSTTALVHELYLQLAANRQATFDEAGRFYAYAAQAMRHILIDGARHRQRQKAGGDLRRVDLDVAEVQDVQLTADQALELDRSLRLLEAENPRAAQVVELHFFAGLPIDKIAELKQLSTRTIDRDWRFAKAFLQAHISG
jgi:RNA polymerase sigma factor (TIGR02999 family)